MTALADIRSLLPHTWHGFFGRFGRLRPVQEAAIPPLARGESVLVSAPTAAGKTEAIIAPLLERAFALGPVSSLGLHTLVVSPTRALCNDLLRRLRGPVTACGLRPAIKTGDSNTLGGAKAAHLLITTPESLDSLLSRQPRTLRSVRSVLLDELHLVDTTARGDQLRYLLSRLARVADEPLQLSGASATLPEAESIARRYLGPESCCVSTPTAFAGGQRGIDAQSKQAATLIEAGRAIAETFERESRSKLLVFANRRSDVEALVNLLRGKPRLAGRVMAHHGSLAREERLRVERRFLDAPSAICIATMTLEIGIDIAEIDGVVLLGPPPNVSSLLQRVGRSNRAENTARVLCLYRGKLEHVRFEHLLACAQRSDLFGESIAFRPAVLAQQALSLLFQNPKRWVSAASLHDRLPADLRDILDLTACKAILDGLVKLGEIRAVGSSRYVAEESAERAYELGRMHSNIDSSAEIEVVDETTGRAVGTARLSKSDRKAASAGGAVAISLGGQRREVARVVGHQAMVRSAPGQEDAQFVAQQAPRYSYGLARDLAAHLGLPPKTLVVTRLGDERWRVAHFLGTVWGRLLGGLFSARGWSKRTRGGAFFLMLDRKPDETQLGSKTGLLRQLQQTVDKDLNRLSRLLQPGPFGRAVPRTLTRRWFCESADLERLAEVLSQSELVEGEVLDEKSG